LTSMPPITATPVMRIRGAPGAPGPSPPWSTPPIRPKAPISTSASSGTVISMPPITATPVLAADQRTLVVPRAKGGTQVLPRSAAHAARDARRPWNIALIVGAIMISTPVQSGEEIGWRGYALPRLAARMGFARAGVLLGVIWAAWHLPFFFVPGIDMYRQSFLLFVFSVTALSVAITWLYVRTNGSLLLTMLMHSAVNQTVGIVSDVGKPGNLFALRVPLSFLLTVVFLWIPAVYFLIRMPNIVVGNQPSPR